MGVFPPTIHDQRALELLGRCLAADTTPEQCATLRLEFFSPGFSWNRLVRLAVEQNILIPLIYCLKERGLLLPVPLRPGTETLGKHPTPQLESFYLQHLERRENLRSQLIDIAKALNEHNIVPLALKGARYLLADAPAWAEARSMRDIDILVGLDAAARAHETLIALGYSNVPSLSMTDHHLTPMMKEGFHGTIELHTKALVQDARTILSTDRILSLSRELRSGEAQLRTMPANWQMLMGLLHHQIGDRGYRRRVLTLKGLWEFVRESRELSESDWQTILSFTGSHGGRRALEEWLVLAETLFGLTPPVAIDLTREVRKRAAVTLRWSGRPARLRQALYFADILMFAFSSKRLAMRYGCEPRGLMLRVRLRHLLFLVMRHSRLQLSRIFARED